MAFASDRGLFCAAGVLTLAGHARAALAAHLLVPHKIRMVFTNPTKTEADGAAGINQRD